MPIKKINWINGISFLETNEIFNLSLSTNKILSNLKI